MLLWKIRWLPLSIALGATLAGLLLAGSVQERPARAALPGLNGLIAFTSNRDGNDEIYVMQPNGSGQTRLTTNTAGDQAPAWSPTGGQIAFASNREGGNWDVYVMNSDGTNQTRLTTSSGFDFRPSWSPDGTKITFYSNRDGNLEVYVMDANGANQTNITNNPNAEYWPQWSPLGNKISFITTRDGNVEVYSMNTDGSGQTNLSNNPLMPDQEAGWSPDGAKIAYHRRPTTGEIYSMNANGTGQTNLTNHAADDSLPAWSPDGSIIAFTSLRDGNYEIYTMNDDGSGQTRVTNNTFSDFGPDWQPLSGHVHISSDGVYALPKSCYQVRDVLTTPLFIVCDNDFAGPPQTHAACDDGANTICNDEDPAPGEVGVSVLPGTYNVTMSSVAYNHTPDGSLELCVGGPTCSVAFASAPLIKPWYPWDVNGDGVVNIPGDILAVGAHFGPAKP
jgi:Tol biopolymer transport system component